MTFEHAPVIDYAEHPGFANLPSAPPDDWAEQAVREIDEAYAGLCATPWPAEERKHKFDALVTPKIQALQAHLAGRARPQFLRQLDLAMAVASKHLRDDLVARDFSAENRNDTPNLKGPFQNSLPFFRSNGFFKFADAGLARRVWAVLPLERAMLRLRAKQLPFRHSVLSLHRYSPAGRMIRNMVTRSGLLDFVSAYTGKPMEFLYAALDYSHPAQTWYKDCYSDVGLPTSKTVYMHTDADFDIVKTLFYLQDVGDKDGPFRFVAGSHRWERSPLAVAVQKGFDQSSHDVFPDVVVDGDYYRVRFKLAEHRQDLMSLPAQLRGSTHFGDDILDDSELSERLLEAEVKFTGPAGTFVTFDGSRGIHRGGQVRADGLRWAIQLAFQVRRGPPPGPMAGIVRELHGTLSYVKFFLTRLAGLAAGRVIT